MIAALLAVALSLSAAEPTAKPRVPPPWGTGASAAEDLEIGLVIFGPGPDVASWFGHAALAVKDRKLKKSRLYNYGEFSFDAVMLGRFVLGHLNFWLGERAVERTLDLYRKEGRAIRTLELALSPQERMDVARFLADNALPDNKHYRYDHFTDNCATKPRDVLDKAIGGKLQKASSTARMTLREHTLRHTSVFMPVGWALDFVLNDTVDVPLSTWEEAFLPSELERSVRAAGLVKAEVINNAVGSLARDDSPSLFPWLLLLGLLSATTSIALAMRSPRALAAWTSVFALLGGIPGAALFVMWSFTDHVVTYGNENILLANPLTWLAGAFGVAALLGSKRALRILPSLWMVLAVGALAGLCIKVLPWFDQANAPHLALFVPAVLGNAVAWRMCRRRDTPAGR